MRNDNFITVKVSNDELLEMLLERWKFWDKDGDTKLIEAYYQDMIDNGLFEGVELNISLIVDNDYVNYLELYEPSEKDQMLEDFNCSTIEELQDKCFVFECEYGYVVRQ